MGGSSKKVTVGYKYYVGMHMALCHGPVDKIVRIMVGGKKAWIGENAGGALTIDKPDLFGGEKREGGVSGQVDIEMGAPDQGQNAYLAAKLGADLLPAFRGVCCAVLRQVYIGLNPYLKDWGWLVQRIHKRQNGQAQWYDEKAAIGQYTDDGYGDVTALPYTLLVDVGASMWGYRVVPQDDTTNYAYQSAMTAHGKAPFANVLPYGTVDLSSPWLYDNYAPPSDAAWTRVDLLTTLWMERDVHISDTRPVHISVSADNEATIWVNGVEIGSGVGLANAIYYPESLSFVVTIKVIEYHGDNSTNRKYADCYMWQDAVSDPAPYYFGRYSDMNPAHIIRECLTDTNWGMGYPESDIDDVSFTDAADKLYAEGMGMSILWSQQTSIEDFAEEILRHIDAALYVDRTTGKFVLKLIRADYIESSLLVLDQSNISRVEGYTKQTLAELVNEITVTYDSNETGQAETVTLQNLAMIQQQGAIIQATVDYPGFAHQRIAAKVAARDLKAMSTPLASATLYANREAAGLNIGSVFRWNWVEQDEDGNGIATSYIMRVTEIAFGDGVDNTVRIQCAQDVFALPDIVYVEAEPTEWTDPTAAPLPATPRLVTETPYYEIVRRLGEVDAATKLTSLPELGYLMVAAGRPAAEINAELQVDSGAGYVEGGTLDFCPCAKLDGDVGFLDTSATLKDGVDLDEFVAGSLAQIDDEIIVVESIVDGVATIRRGCLDTVPAAHADGSAVIIWDGYTASDDVEYVASDDVDVKILTITGQGPLSLLDAPVDSVVMDQRAIRPYPPANVKINDQYYPDLIETTPDLTVTWAHRDRLQQTGGTVLGWTDASVGPESGVNYGLRLVRDDTDEELVSATDVAAAVATLSSYYSGDVRLELWAMRDGLSSLQKWMHTFVHHPAGAFNDLATCYRGDTATGNVLDNDTSVMTAVSRVAGDSANIGIAVAGSNGGLFTISSDGSWFFDPNGDFDLLDEGLTAETSVTYHATNGSSESSATLTVTITTLNWWTPEELGGAVYFDPDFLDLMTLDGTAITALRSVYNAAIELTQGTSTARPQLLSGTLNGANEISFDGGDFLQTDTSLGFGSSPVTFFLVEREMSGGIGAAPLSFNSGPNGGIVFQKNTTGLQPFSPNIPFESTQERILMYVRPQQGVAYCAKDGVITGTDDTTTGTYGSSFALGKRLNGGYLLGGGKITAALMIPRLLKNTEIAKVVGYLAHAKGITGNLQASHPYKTEKPVVEIYSGPTDPYWSNVVLCLNADGYNGDRGVDDAKGKQVFPFGNTQIITSPGYNAIRLDDSGDYAKVNAHTDFDFGSADWCVEGWIYRYALGGGFFVQRGWGVSQGIFLVFNSSGNLEIQLGNGSWFFSKTATITAGLNTLFHVAVVRNGAAIKVYQNGVEVMSQPVSGTLSSGLGAFVGADPGNSYYALNCHIKGLRVTKGVPRYTAAFTPEAAPFPIA